MTQRMRWTCFLPLLALGLWVDACSDSSPVEVQSCTADQDCPAGEICLGGYCRPGEVVDGGPTDGGDEQVCLDGDGDGYGEGCSQGEDCDDTDPQVYPGAFEYCDDDIDNDCDGETDESDCRCSFGDRKICYTGSTESRGVGICHDGLSICSADGSFGECLAQQLPLSEICDGEDNDCDGATDERLLNACGECDPPDSQLAEICDDGLDNDCNGVIDEGCNCDPDCECGDQDAGENCTCHPPIHQPCYGGSPADLGLGICRGGHHDCVELEPGSWGFNDCVGQVLPRIECENGVANGLDDDCDGMTDEDCLGDMDADGYRPPEDCNDQDPNIHPGAEEICNGLDDDCNRLVDEAVTNACGGCGPIPAELCSDGIDNDCNGIVDDSCGGCTGSDSRPCYRGPGDTVEQGVCTWGTQTCDGEFWSVCTGDALPTPEICDGLDNDCDGETDEQWAAGSNACGSCSGTETCDGLDNDCDGLTDEGLRNTCDQCLPVFGESTCDGLDNDCDGLIDEGLLNACGSCGHTCFQQTWDGQEDWPQGQTDGVSNQVDPDQLRLDSQSYTDHFIWIAGTNTVCNSASGCLTDPGCYLDEACNTVRKINTRTLEIVGVYSSWGWSPSRTAGAADSSVWVGNRGRANGVWDGSDPRHGNAVHLSPDGELLCRADVTAIEGSAAEAAVRAVTLDKDGNAWLGSWDRGKIYKYSGSQVDDSQADGIPRCVLLCEVDLQGNRAYGAAVDSEGFLWTSGAGTDAVQIDTTNCTVVTTVDLPYTSYGIAIDRNDNPWFGEWGYHCVAMRLDRLSGQVLCVQRTVGDTSTGRTRGVAVDEDSNVWVAEWDHSTVSKIAPDGTHLGQWSVSDGVTDANHPLGMAVDLDNNIWAVNYSSSNATKYSPDGSILSISPVGANSYSYSDMTGYQLRTFTQPVGTWTVDFDSGYQDARWDSIRYSGTMDADDQIRIRARSAPAREDLGAAVYSPYQAAAHDVAPPWTANIGGEVPPGRWLQVEVTLNTDDPNSPAFSSLQVFWQY